jgi:hypothetical protein
MLAKRGGLPLGSATGLISCLQVEMMSNTTILISPCGGIATVLAFLQPEATGLVALLPLPAGSGLMRQACRAPIRNSTRAHCALQQS